MSKRTDTVVVLTGNKEETLTGVDGIDFMEGALIIFSSVPDEVVLAAYAPGCWSKIEFK